MVSAGTEETPLDQTLAEMGNMELDGRTYEICSTKQDAISVHRTLLLNSENLKATAACTSSSSSDDTSSKAVKAGTTIYIPETAGSMTLTSSRDDTLHCNPFFVYIFMLTLV